MDNPAAPGGRLYGKPTRSNAQVGATERVGFFWPSGKRSFRFLTIIQTGEGNRS